MAPRILLTICAILFLACKTSTKDDGSRLNTSEFYDGVHQVTELTPEALMGRPYHYVTVVVDSTVARIGEVQMNLSEIREAMAGKFDTIRADGYRGLVEVQLIQGVKADYRFYETVHSALAELFEQERQRFASNSGMTYEELVKIGSAEVAFHHIVPTRIIEN